MPAPSSVLYPGAATFPGNAEPAGRIELHTATGSGIRIDDTTWRRP